MIYTQAKKIMRVLIVEAKLGQSDNNKVRNLFFRFLAL